MSELDEMETIMDSGGDLVFRHRMGSFSATRLRDAFLSLSDDEKVKNESQSKKSVEQKILLQNNTCKYCKLFTCVADSEEGVYICTNPRCGRGNGEILDSSQEWRSPSSDDVRRGGDPSRVGMPINKHFRKASMATFIPGSSYYGYRQRQKFNSMEYGERSLMKNFQQIENSTEDMVSDAVKETAQEFFAKISENEKKRGKKKNSNMAACVLYASESREVPADKEKLCEAFSIPKKKFTKGCNFYREQMFEKEPDYYAKMKPVSAEDEIKRIAKIINFPEVYRNIACYVAYMAQELGIVIKNTPISIAVGSIFLVATVYDIELDRKNISSRFEISDVTINKSLNLLSQWKSYLIPTKRLFDKYMEKKSIEKVED